VPGIRCRGHLRRCQPRRGGAVQTALFRLRDDERKVFKNKEWALAQADALRRMEERITYVEQPTPEGYGHAVYQAKDFVGDEPFLLLLGDHVYISGEKSAAPSR
jgi:UTP--glucose-1-phosphate uridylyltransferase